MEFSPERLPTRLIICVDGTWCNPDGTRTKPLTQPLDVTGEQQCNLTNVYQIYISVKEGKCIDSQTGKAFNQCRKYIHGLASKADVSLTQRAWAGFSGHGYEKQILHVYEECCKLQHEDDEVWLYGFSRGAFVVRAVAGMLHYLRAINSAGTPAFQAHYKEALGVYKAMYRQGRLGMGQVSWQSAR
jgi:uncharacterized protein (DUF2235 family)